MKKIPVYVDTDVGLGTPGAEIDDGAAMIFLLRHTSMDLLGTGSIFGNVPSQDATLNLDRLLHWLDREHIPLGVGAEKPLLADMTWFDEWQSRYDKTLPWDTRPSRTLAANLLIEVVRSQPGQVSILSLGPMTNLALALRLNPGIVPITRRVIVMGGSFNMQNPQPEFNARCDPEAAQIVFGGGWDVHILGLEITRRVHFSREDFSSLPAGHPAIDLLRTQAPGWIDRMEEMGWDRAGCALHDAVAAAYLADVSLFQTEETGVEVELTDPKSRGVTRFSKRSEGGATVRVVTDVDVEKCRDLIWSQICR